jgi:hypothetical protein
MKLTKAQRAELREKFGGKCACCGCDLPERWHADHFIPCKRDLESRKVRSGVFRLTSVGSGIPSANVIENMMPACPPCNISKGSMSLEGWRLWISGHTNSLNQYHPIYRLAKAYGLIRETGAAVVFYFERAERDGHA